MTPVITDYPVFEADQVLSQKHLNKLISYLEEQDRLSRVSLLGMGIVCGLDISKPNETTVNIGCGTAITSLGFLIPFETSSYTHFKNTTISEHFLHPDLEKHPYLEAMYSYAQLYAPFENCLELLPTDSDDEDKEVLTKNILDDKVIMLLLEVPLIDEKNCVAIDCADKGKRLEFKARPLLIDREELEDSDILLNLCQNKFFARNPLPKYNVAATNLITGQHVLDAFNTQIIKGKQRLHHAIKLVRDHYAQELGGLTDFAKLGNTITQINTLQSRYKNDIHIQYVADWMSDLTATYHEIAQFNTCNPTICCPNNDLFPFHVLLGLAEFETQDIQTENDLYRFRTPFIKTGILAEEEKEKKAELVGLLNKLIHQAGFFDIHLEAIKKDGIKITPSLLGATPLSKRAIPFYYRNINELVHKWSPELTTKGLQKHILSYHSAVYNTTDDQVSKPLHYDTEPYDFYRIEGHIGKRYDEALTTIIAQQRQHRLPFKVVALNASNYAKKKVDISKHVGDWNDLELDYDMSRKKIFNITQHVINWIKLKKTQVITNTIMTETTINDLSDILAKSRDLLSEDLQEFLFEYENFYKVFKRLNDIFALQRRCIILLNAGGINDFLEDLIDHFDEINSLFLEDPFTVIVEEAHRRWEEQYKNLFLAKFLEDHPGIDHKAGVPKGGTFIMVYIDSSIFAKSKFRGFLAENLLTRINNYQTLFNFSEAETEKIISVNTHIKPRTVKPASIEIKNECAEALERTKGSILDNLKFDLGTNVPDAVRDFMLDKMRGVFDRNLPDDVTINRIPEKVVIADFYLPYICCSKGNNINIVLPPADRDQTIIADFETSDFNDNDFFTNIE